MRLAYVVPSSAYAHPGIQSGVATRLATWEGLGVRPVLVTQAEIQPPRSFPERISFEIRDDKLLSTRVSALVRDRAVDAVLLRYYAPGPRWASLAPVIPTFLDVHSRLDRPERPRDFARIIWNASNWARLVSRVRGACFVTEELSNSRGFRRIPHRHVTGNGTLIEQRPAPVPPTHSVPTIVMAVGSTARWHGVDRFMELAAALRGEARCQLVARPDVAAQVGGMPGFDPTTMAVAQDQNEYEEILSQAHVGIGTLALDRKGLMEAAPLKVRDYVRLGIPTILPYIDTNLRLAPADQCMVHRSWDRGFVEFALQFARAVAPLRLNQSTRQTVSLKRIERDRVQFMREHLD